MFPRMGSQAAEPIRRLSGPNAHLWAPGAELYRPPDRPRQPVAGRTARKNLAAPASPWTWLTNLGAKSRARSAPRVSYISQDAPRKEPNPLPSSLASARSAFPIRNVPDPNPGFDAQPAGLGVVSVRNVHRPAANLKEAYGHLVDDSQIAFFHGGSSGLDRANEQRPVSASVTSVPTTKKGLSRFMAWIHPFSKSAPSEDFVTVDLEYPGTESIPKHSATMSHRNPLLDENDASLGESDLRMASLAKTSGSSQTGRDHQFNSGNHSSGQPEADYIEIVR